MEQFLDWGLPAYIGLCALSVFTSFSISKIEAGQRIPKRPKATMPSRSNM
jgi:hypothetical protein